MADTTKKAEEKKSVFETLNSIDVSKHTDKKGNLTYLSWAWAWAEVKKAYPKAFYTVYENADGWNYFTDGKTCWVKTGVTIDDLEHIEYLPIMDYKNNSIPLERVTSFDVNKAIQRSLTKASARHGLGLYIYAGEDLPEDSSKQSQNAPEQPQEAQIARPASKSEFTCANCGNAFSDAVTAKKSMERWHKYICLDCIKKKQVETKRKQALAEAKRQAEEAQAQPAQEEEMVLPFEIT